MFQVRFTFVLAVSLIDLKMLCSVSKARSTIPLRRSKLDSDCRNPRPRGLGQVVIDLRPGICHLESDPVVQRQEVKLAEMSLRRGQILQRSSPNLSLTTMS